MAKNAMKNIWKDRQKEEERLKKLHQRKNHGTEKVETAQNEKSTETSAET